MYVHGSSQALVIAFKNKLSINAILAILNLGLVRKLLKSLLLYRGSVKALPNAEEKIPDPVVTLTPIYTSLWNYIERGVYMCMW